MSEGTLPHRLEHHIRRIHIFVLPRRKLEIMVMIAMILIATVCALVAMYNAYKEWESYNYHCACKRPQDKYK